jgi:CRISPR-associated protein Csd1
MILQALDGYYHRLAEREQPPVPVFGYTYENISFALVIAADGTPVDLIDLRTQGPRPVPASISVPQSFKRPGTTPRSFFLWDKTAFVLGVKRAANDKAKWLDAPREHAAFRKLHEELLATSDDEGLGAVLNFLALWTPAKFGTGQFKSSDILDTNVVFRLDGDRGLVHDRPAAREIWAKHLAAGRQAGGVCLVTGKESSFKRVHPPIRHIRSNGTNADSIVCYNKPSFESFGKKQGANAPVSEQAAFAYTTALNHLLRPGDHNRQRLQVGDATTVFWAEAASAAGEAAAEAAEDLFGSLLAPPAEDALGEKATGRLRAILEKVAAGRPLQEIDPALDPGTRCFVLGLAPNASRLSVRFWQVDDLGTLVARLGEHWHDLAIEPRPWKMAPEPWRLVGEMAPKNKSRKSAPEKKEYNFELKNVPPTLAGETMRSILTGGHYPETLFASVVMRCRTDRELNGIRAAILKACLVRADRKAGRKESVSVSLDTQETNAGYRLGRLFAVLESIQRTALGPVNASIRDRYYGAASATPGAVFPVLLRTAGHHLANVRKGDKTKLAGWFEREIGEIMDGIGTSLPRNLAIADQGRFAIGYYHQRYGRHKVAPPEVATDLQDAPSEDEV